MTKVSRLAPILTVLVVLGIVLALLFAAPAHAEGQPKETPTPVLSSKGTPEIPPVPTVPTQDQYREGPTLQELANARPDGWEEDVAADQHPCIPASWLKLTYYNKAIPDDHGGGYVEGYTGFHYGRLSDCKLYVQPVGNSRVTHGGEIDHCLMEITVDRYKPLTGTRRYWQADRTREPCNMVGAGAYGPTDKFVFPVNKWTSRGYHYFKDQEERFWYAAGNTYTKLNY